ncbi:unnamed protein product [Rhizoctonia solani]|uniref:Fe2OG dioxygenase domain-containing protein n=1 Tax=Rhizoctonia solani TaxID=456999 RepID=A0A8H3CTY0_9AGAM|nr:unnamed protein product [Rhizoctonia solani]
MMTTVDLPSLAAQPVPPFKSIPVIDISGLYGDVDSKIQVASAIREACIQVGFFYVKTHGVAEAKITSALNAARQFFDQPMEEKMKIKFHRTNTTEGYHIRTRTGYSREAFEFTPKIDASNKSVPASDLWPSEDVIPGFREAMLNYHISDEVYRLGSKLFQAFALALNMPEDFFLDKVRSPIAHARVNHYTPQINTSTGLTSGIGEHTDALYFTVLWQGEIPALQVMNTSREWVTAQPIPGTFVINACFLDDIFKSTIHRAIVEPGIRRFSIPMFFGTDDDVVIDIVPTCISASRPALYEPLLVSEFMKLRREQPLGADRQPKKIPLPTPM